MNFDKYKNWCPEIYRNVFIDRYNSDQLRVAPCCAADAVIEPADTFDFENSVYLKSLRDQFDQNQQPRACHRCWDAEQVGQKSRRQGAIEFYDPDQTLGIDNTVQLEGIDHSVTWACNLACVMCGPSNSSTWATELNVASDRLASLGRMSQKHNKFIEQLDVTHLKRLYFNGGEPFINKDHVVWLSKLAEKRSLTNLVLSYNTNGTFVPTSEVLDLWQQCKLVKLYFSIDATGLAYNYIRYPGQWQDVANNMIKIKNTAPDNVMFGFVVTVGTYNILDLVEIWQWFEKNLLTNRPGDPSDFCHHFAYNYDIKWLTPEVKKAAVEQLDCVAEFAGVTNYLKSTMDLDSNSSWIEKLTAIDQRRGTDWKNTLNVGKYY